MENEPNSGQSASNAGAVILLLGALVLCVAALWDAAGRLITAPSWWPVAGYVGIAAGVALGCIAVLADMLLTRRGQRRASGTALCMVTLGVLLGAWLLRGHPEIPADPPIVVAQLAAAVVLLIASLRRRQSRR